jgi:DNA-binding transcriptional ArsR family regulator
LTLRNESITLRRMNAFAFFSDPTRLQIVELLADSGEMPAGKIAERFDMTRAGVSRHLRTLEDAGVLIVRLDAQRRLYRLNPAPFRELDAWLHKYRRFWSRGLRALARHVDDRERG